MTLLAHGTMGALMAYLFTVNPIILLLAFILGALPDIVGYLDGKIRGAPYRWRGLYDKFHNPRGFWKLLYFIPPIALHIIIDKPMHDTEHGGWKWWTYGTEILFWITLALYFLGII